MKRVLTAGLALSVLLILASPQNAHSSRVKSQSLHASSDAQFKDLMRRVWAAWQSGDVSRAAQFYSKQAQNVYFDITPVKYNGWSEYESGVKNVLANFQSAKFLVNDDAVVHRAGRLTWGTATIATELVPKNGSAQTMTLRWTVVWERTGTDWLIIHEHVSAPLK